ncbi:putative ABC family ABC transporter [Heracleum sosnowskyi]|uniref:ABC family ABC transporter n=1 Tax=Heracleum sosnowskyi TaxID=360622 RepID=A0AAD8M7Q1_9APIA|nr:putative ABC family ABC transporter [Heracleum sosnowskyi]
MQTKDESNDRSSKLPEPLNLQNLRCYSASYATFSSYVQPKIQQVTMNEDNKLKRAMSLNGWTFDDHELRRKKRVASYRVYSVEKKVKGSVKKSFKWLKNRFSQMISSFR